MSIRIIIGEFALSAYAIYESSRINRMPYEQRPYETRKSITEVSTIVGATDGEDFSDLNEKITVTKQKRDWIAKIYSQKLQRRIL